MLSTVPGHLIRFKTRYQRYIDDFVLHCHILDLEDQGMMQNIGSRFRTAEAVLRWDDPMTNKRLRRRMTGSDDIVRLIRRAHQSFAIDWADSPDNARADFSLRFEDR
jgi:hypothetical protein